MIRFLATLMLSLVLFSGAAFAQDNAALDRFERTDVRAVTTLLSGYHELASPELFAGVPQAEAIVDAIARGPHSFHRDRALAALGKYWPSADVYLLYANVVASDDTAEGTRHRVIMMFAEAFGDRAIPALRPLLGSSDVQLQLTTVNALGRIGTDESRAMLLALAETAKDPVLLEQIDRSSRVLR